MGYPIMDGSFQGKSHLVMDDDWGYRYEETTLNGIFSIIFDDPKEAFPISAALPFRARLHLLKALYGCSSRPPAGLVARHRGMFLGAGKKGVGIETNNVCAFFFLHYYVLVPQIIQNQITF